MLALNISSCWEYQSTVSKNLAFPILQKIHLNIHFIRCLKYAQNLIIGFITNINESGSVHYVKFYIHIV